MESYGDPRRLSMNMKINLRFMHRIANHERLCDHLEPLMQSGNFEKAEALPEQEKFLSFITKDLQEVLDNVDAVLCSSKRPAARTLL